MTKAFISYSREDRGFVEKLAAALKSRQQDVWVDLEDIPPSAEWWKEITTAITEAENFVFVLSPNSAVSECCGKELAVAVQQHKRLVPVLLRPVQPKRTPEPLAKLQFLTMGDGEAFETSVDALLATLDTDLEWVRAHTRLLIRATEWDAKQREASFLLRGMDLQDALHWLATALIGKAPEPTTLQRDYVEASRQWEAQEIQRLQALYDKTLARALAFEAEDTARIAPNRQEESVLVALEAVKRHPSAQANSALRRTLALLLPPAYWVPDEDHIHADAVSADGRWVAQLDSSGVVRVFSLDSGQEQMRTSAIPDAQSEFSAQLELDGAGTHLFVLARRRELQIWDVASGTLRANWTCEAFAVADAPQLLARITGLRLQVSHLRTGELRLDERFPAPLHALGISPDGAYVAVAGEDGKLHVLSVSGAHPPFVLPSQQLRLAFAFSEDGLLLGSGGAEGVAIWSLPEGQPRFALPLDEAVTALAFDAPGLQVAVATGRTARVLSLTDRSERCRVTQDEDLHAVRISPDGRWLATCGVDHSARLWELETGREISRLGHRSQISQLRFLAGRDRLATVGSATRTRVWQLHAPIVRMAPTPRGYAHDVAFSPDGRLLAAGCSDGLVRLWQVADAFEPPRILDHRHFAQPGWDAQVCLGFDGTGRLLACGCGMSAVVWDLTAGGVIATFPADQPAQCVALSPDGSLLATGGNGGHADIWRIADRTHVERLDGGKMIWSLTFSPDGRFLGVATGKGLVEGTGHGIVWDIPSGAEWTRLTHPDGYVHAIAFSADGRLIATAGSDGFSRLLELGTKVRLALFRHESNVEDAAFSPDGKCLATAGADQVVAVWSLDTFEEIRRIPHGGLVTTVRFSPDGRHLATGGHDNQAHVWDFQEGQELARESYPGPVSAVRFSPDGRYVAVAGTLEHPGGVWLWRPDDLIAAACGRLTRNLMRDEWQRYLPDEPYRATCAQLPSDADPAP